MSFKVAAFYRFTPFDAPENLRADLFDRLDALGARGTVLLAGEGLNGTIAAEPDALDRAVGVLRCLPGCAGLQVKYSEASEMPFWRLKVRLKQEIVTMGVPGTNPEAIVGTYVAPEDWNALISDPDTVVIDTRNDYEYACGSFEGAIDPETESFREFPDWFRNFRARLESEGRTPKIAMFCTGGIRCEKATSFVKSEGVDDVYHLEGGILKYLETVPERESLWRGECFVFDQRVAVKHGLEEGSYALCHACQRPVSAAEREDPRYVAGISCPACHGEIDEARRARFVERQKQMKLARERGGSHLGARRTAEPGDAGSSTG